MIPEVRTSRSTANALSAAALAALALAVLFGSQLQDSLDSEIAATLVLVVWCLTGAGAAIAAVVDAYIGPDGELLGLIATIVATIFGVLALLVVIGIVVGATGVMDTETPAEASGQALLA